MLIDRGTYSMIEGDTVVVSVPVTFPPSLQKFYAPWKRFARDVAGLKVTLVDRAIIGGTSGWNVETTLTLTDAHKGARIWIPTIWLTPYSRQGYLFND